LNAVLIFVSGFALPLKTKSILVSIDNIITTLFIVELVVKFKEFGIKGYFKSNWNKFDFLLIALSIPTLISFLFHIQISNISFLLAFRVMRVFKSFRFLKFIPGIDALINEIGRALKASVIVLLGFMIYIFIIGIFSFYLFLTSAPEYFSNPAVSLYSIFKIFTVEGWFEIPEQITKTYSTFVAFSIYLYFIFVLLTGGIFGLSLVNSIFVDALVSDNNDELEKKIDNLDKKISELLTQNTHHDRISK
jgi:voltage-gated sodium channel